MMVLTLANHLLLLPRSALTDFQLERTVSICGVIADFVQSQHTSFLGHLTSLQGRRECLGNSTVKKQTLKNQVPCPGWGLAPAAHLPCGGGRLLGMLLEVHHLGQLPGVPALQLA
ncbi:hypothetical protein HaLaN_26224, partial [Haematococcus lacustris]